MKKIIAIIILIGIAFSLGACGNKQDSETKTDYVIEEAEDVFPEYEMMYFIPQLPGNMQRAAARIYKGLMSYERSIDLSGYSLDTQEVSVVHQLLQCECSELFHVDFLKVGLDLFKENNKVYLYKPGYLIKEEDYPGALKTLYEKTEEILYGFEETGASGDIKKFGFVVNCLANTLNIEDTEFTGTNSVYEALVLGKAKCDGVAHTVQYLMQKLGVQTLFISGKNKPADIGHAWNAVKLEGKWCEIDVTGALKTGDLEYFLGSKGSELEEILEPSGIYSSLVKLPDFDNPVQMNFDIEE